MTDESSRVRRALIGAWVVVFLALLVLLPFAVVRHRTAEDNSAASLRAQALVAVDDAVVDLMSPQEGASDSYVKGLLSRSTGAFRDQVRQLADTLQKTMAEADVRATATVSASAVSSVDAKKREAVVIVAIQQQLKNKQAPQGEPRYYRLRVDAKKIGSRWLMSDMRFVA